MPFNIIEKIQKAPAEFRPAIIQGLYQKNLNFFATHHLSLYNFLESTHCPYHIDITDRFLNIIDERTGEIAHPAAGLDNFSQMLGNWTHEAWVDLFNFHIPLLHNFPIHYEIVQNFSTRFHKSFPEIEQRLNSGRINLKTTEEDRKFSPPVVFLGLFHGLHIAHYLHNTDLSSGLFIEPEPERFEVSCYFLDFEEIEQRLGRLYIAIGDDMTVGSIESFFSLLRITPMLWTRVLCGYPYEKANLFIESLKTLQATRTNLRYPLDNELDGHMHGVISINECLPILTTRPRLSEQCRIAIVATGPSLENDLVWLKENQKNLIIFAVHSAVKVLREHEIKPDFQFNIDAIIPYNFVKELHLFPDVPFITDYKAPPHIIGDFVTPLLCASTHKNSVIHFYTSLTETHPSTTNLAFSFACWINPIAIYLLGCDCGYRDIDINHAKGSAYYQQEKSLNYAVNSLQSFAEPNFSRTEPIQTIPQHIQTKITIERCIISNAQGIKIENFSDGVLINGATPQFSSNVTLPKYSKKKQDINKIIHSFNPAQVNFNWEHFAETGAYQLQKLKKNLLKALSLDAFSWQNTSHAFDTALSIALLNKRTNEDDHRMHMYYRVLGDLLSLWYRGIILLDDTNEASKVYTEGFRLFKEALDTLDWPSVFDSISDDSLDELLPAKWKMYQALLYGKRGNFSGAASLVAQAYAEDEQIQDGYARLGDMYAEHRNWQATFDLAVQDERLERLSPHWQIYLAQLYGRQNDYHHGCILIERAYSADFTLKNGFAQLGWILTENRMWDAALKIMQRDLEANRISAEWKVNIAQLYARTGDFEQAQSLVSQAYIENPHLTDGLAKLGWILMENQKWHEAHSLMSNDLKAEKLSPGWKIKLGIVNGCLNRWKNAKHLVAEAYNEDPTINEGFSWLGWWGYLLGKNSSFFKKMLDLDEQRTVDISSNILLLRALYQTTLDNLEVAITIVDKAYKKDASLKDWYTAIGWLKFSRGKTNQGLDLMKIDHTLGRMDDVWLVSYGVVLGLCGKSGEAFKILEKVIHRDSGEDRYTIGHVMIPDAKVSIAQLRILLTEGITPENIKKILDYPTCPPTSI